MIRRTLLSFLTLLAFCGSVRADSFALDPVQFAAQAAMSAPVQMVNGKTGQVVIPAYIRQSSSALTPSSADGTVSWNFPSPFSNMPTCWPSLATTSTTYTFDYPVQTSISLSSVSFIVSAHPKSMTITSLTLPIVLQFTPPAPPTGTALTISCLAPA